MGNHLKFTAKRVERGGSWEKNWAAGTWACGLLLAMASFLKTYRQTCKNNAKISPSVNILHNRSTII